jgi:hypothetical protein
MHHQRKTRQPQARSSSHIITPRTVIHNNFKALYKKTMLNIVLNYYYYYYRHLFLLFFHFDVFRSYFYRFERGFPVPLIF